MANPRNPDSRNLDLPIALRRTPRLRVSAATTPEPAVAETPRKRRVGKRVRFSDPEPEDSHRDTNGLCSTGLTPMVKRSSLGEPPTKRRRVPGAGAGTGVKTTIRRRAWTTALQTEESIDDVDILSLPSSPTDCVQRRGRRDKIRQSSEGVTTKRATTKPRTRKENRTREVEVEAEIKRLRSELAERDAEIERLHNATLIHDTERILDLELEIKTLRAELARQQLPAAGADEDDDGASDCDVGDNIPSRSFYNWTLAARKSFTDTYSDEADEFKDMTMADIACSTPSRRRKTANATPAITASASFPTPPSTSPPQPATPSSARRAIMPATPQCHIGIQATLPDPEKEALEAELGSLRHELGILTATLETHATQQTQLSEKLANALPAPSPGTESTKTAKQELEGNLDQLLQLLSDRTKALQDVAESLTSLGFPGATASEILANIKSSFRAARLELECLAPGSTEQPLSARGAEILDLVLSRLRDFAGKARSDADAIDEYRAIELSLREQLSAQDDGNVLRERDERIAELEADIQRLRGAADGYKRDIAELESHRENGTAKLEADLTSAREQLAQRGAVVEELEGKVNEAKALAVELGGKLKDLQRRRDAETKVRNQSAGAALALRDARVLELRREIAGVRDGLRVAQETILGLRVENAVLARRVEVAEGETRGAQEVAEKLKGEIEVLRATRRSRSCTPEPRSGSFFSGELARSGKGKGRQRDSGLGFLEEEDAVGA